MSVDALDARIETEWTALQRQLGDCGVAQDAFVSCVKDALHARRPGPLDPADVDTLCLEDLYLAQGCLTRSDRAIRVFLERYGADLRALSQRHAPRPDIGDDVEAQLLATLFLPRRPDAPESARLASYRGIGSLKGWLRVTARRLVIDLLRRTQREVGDEKIPHAASPNPTAAAELEVLEAVGRLRPIVTQAMAQLEPDARDMLRRYYRDGVVLKDLGATYGRDTTWAFRQLASIRARLFKQIKRTAQLEHGLSLDDLRALLADLADGLDLSALLSLLLLWALMADTLGS